MHVELLSLLRCVVPHDDANLVTAVMRSADGRVMDGILGCSVCGAEYPIRNGNAIYGEPLDAPAQAERAHAAQAAESAEQVTRLAAMLALDERAGLWVLDSAWEPLAEALTALVPVRAVRLSQHTAFSLWPAIVGAGDRIPLAAGTVRGIAIDRASPALGAAAVAALAPRGRLVGPVTLAVPAGITELARDDRHWVGEREALQTSGPLVIPRRAAPRTGRQ